MEDYSKSSVKIHVLALRQQLKPLFIFPHFKSMETLKLPYQPKCICNSNNIRPEARYGLPPPPRGNFVDHDFLEASCLASFLQHVSPLAMEALPSNSPLHMLPIQRHKFNIKRTEVRIHVNICRCSIKSYFI